jgi:hypothetical protein
VSLKRPAALALVFLAAHLALLPPTLEDIDSINFAMGVRQFDVAHHQPHPPGYPVFIALAKASTAVLQTLGVAAPEVRGLSFWSALAGALACVFVFVLFRTFDDERRAWWTTVVVAACPLFWFTALRPLSDTMGLCVVIGASADLVSAIVHGRAQSLVAAGFLAGLAIGIRSQTLFLIAPLFGLALVFSRVSVRDRLVAVAAAAAGVAIWGIPLLVATGGLSGYLAARGSQAGEDFSGVVMLWTSPQRRVALDAAFYTFLWPWGSLAVGALVTAMAGVGLVTLAWRMPRAAAVLALAIAPYAIFHLLFQENATVRYALPLVVPTAYLAVRCLDGFGRVTLAVGASALAAISLVSALPASVAYARGGAPAFRALADVPRLLDRPVDAVGVHAVNRRAAEWTEAGLPGRVFKVPHGREWLALVEEWRSHPSSVIAFVADPRRTDLQLFDPTARRSSGAYRWPFVEPPFVGGARPGNTDLHLLGPPGWMLDRGWGVTAEVAGITARDGWGPHRKPSVAWVRSRPEGAEIVIGGRHLGSPSDPPVRIRTTLGGMPLDVRDVRPGFFDAVLTIRPGAMAGADGYLPLEVSSEPADGSRREIPVALEQFDLQPPGVPMMAFEEGWQEPEYDRRTGRAWRWMTERATLWVRPIGRDVTLTLSGESPLRYYDSASSVTVSIGERQIAERALAADFSESFVLPADLLGAAGGRVLIQSSRWFVPGDRDGSPDRRHLALTIYAVGVK